MGKSRLWNFEIALLAAFTSLLTTGCLQEYAPSQGADVGSGGIASDSQSKQVQGTVEPNGTLGGEEVNTDTVVAMSSSLLQIQGIFFSGVKSLFSGKGSGSRVSILNSKQSTGRERGARLQPLLQGSCPEVLDRSKSLTEDPLYLTLEWGDQKDNTWETCTTNKGLEMSGRMSLVLDVSDKSLDVTTTSLSFADYNVTADGSTKVQWQKEGILGELAYNDSYVIEYPKGFLLNSEEKSDERVELSVESQGTLGLTLGDGFQLKTNAIAHSSALGDLEIQTDLDYLLTDCFFPTGTLDIHYQLDSSGVVSADILMTMDADRCGILTVQVDGKEPVEYDLIQLLEGSLS